jgi:hypothetical protein
VTERTISLEETLARLRAHRKNIRRYNWLLTTNLTDVERVFIAKRLREEQRAVQALSDGQVR